MREEGIKGYRIVVAVGLLAAFWSQIGAAGSPVVDGHSHEGLVWTDGAIDTTGLQGLADRGIDVVVCLLPVDRSETSDFEQRVRREVETLHRAAAVSGGFALADNPGALQSGLPDDDIRVAFAIEWFDGFLSPDLAIVGRLRDLGVRSIGLVGNDPDGLFESSEGHVALSPFGRRVIREMNQGVNLMNQEMINQEMINPMIQNHLIQVKLEQ